MTSAGDASPDYDSPVQDEWAEAVSVPVVDGTDLFPNSRSRRGRLAQAVVG